MATRRTTAPSDGAAESVKATIPTDPRPAGVVIAEAKAALHDMVERAFGFLQFSDPEDRRNAKDRSAQEAIGLTAGDLSDPDDATDLRNDLADEIGNATPGQLAGMVADWLGDHDLAAELEQHMDDMEKATRKAGLAALADELTEAAKATGESGDDDVTIWDWMSDRDSLEEVLAMAVEGNRKAYDALYPVRQDTGVEMEHEDLMTGGVFSHEVSEQIQNASPRQVTGYIAYAKGGTAKATGAARIGKDDEEEDADDEALPPGFVRPGMPEGAGPSETGLANRPLESAEERAEWDEAAAPQPANRRPLVVGVGAPPEDMTEEELREAEEAQRMRDDKLRRQMAATVREGHRATDRRSRKASRVPVFSLSPEDMRAVNFARGRYSWADALMDLGEVDEEKWPDFESVYGLDFYPEVVPELIDRIAQDTEGGYDPFPLLAKDSPLGKKLFGFFWDNGGGDAISRVAESNEDTDAEKATMLHEDTNWLIDGIKALQRSHSDNVAGFADAAMRALLDDDRQQVAALLKRIAASDDASENTAGLARDLARKLWKSVAQGREDTEARKAKRVIRRAVKARPTRKAKLGSFWVVTEPTELSTLGDIVFETDPQGFVRQVKGGLTGKDIVEVFTTEEEARALGTRLLARRAKKAAGSVDDAWKELQEAYDEHRREGGGAMSFGRGANIGGGVYSYRGVYYYTTMDGLVRVPQRKAADGSGSAESAAKTVRDDNGNSIGEFRLGSEKSGRAVHAVSRKWADLKKAYLAKREDSSHSAESPMLCGEKTMAEKAHPFVPNSGSVELSPPVRIKAKYRLYDATSVNFDKSGDIAFVEAERRLGGQDGELRFISLLPDEIEKDSMDDIKARLSAGGDTDKGVLVADVNYDGGAAVDKGDGPSAIAIAAAFMTTLRMQGEDAVSDWTMDREAVNAAIAESENDDEKRIIRAHAGSSTSQSLIEEAEMAGEPGVYKAREIHGKILEALSDGTFSAEQILEELLQWLPSSDIDKFADEAFGNEGLFPGEEAEEESDEEDEEKAVKATKECRRCGKMMDATAEQCPACGEDVADDQNASVPVVRMTMSAKADVTDQQIRDLRREAATAGDKEQVSICDKALRGDRKARAECARVIADAEAQDDSDKSVPAVRMKAARDAEVWSSDGIKLRGHPSDDLYEISHEETVSGSGTGIVAAYLDADGETWQYVRGDEVDHYRRNLGEEVWLVYVLDETDDAFYDNEGSDKSVTKATKECPECGGRVTEAAASCPHCGYDFTKEEDEAKSLKAKMTIAYTIYDGNPGESGPSSWPDHDGVEMSGRSLDDIKEKIERDAIDAARRSGEYGSDDMLWATIWDPEGDGKLAGWSFGLGELGDGPSDDDDGDDEKSLKAEGEDRKCPDCGSIMKATKDGYVCKCGYDRAANAVGKSAPYRVSALPALEAVGVGRNLLKMMISGGVRESNAALRAVSDNLDSIEELAGTLAGSTKEKAPTAKSKEPVTVERFGALLRSAWTNLERGRATSSSEVRLAADTLRALLGETDALTPRLRAALAEVL